MPAKVLIWVQHPGDLLGQAITFITHGSAQHAGFLRSDGKTVHELYLPTVRDRALTDAEKPFIRAFDIDGLTDEFNTKLERHFDTILASGVQQYSIAELFRILMNMDRPPDDRVCSQYVFWNLKMVSLPLHVRCDEDFITPRDTLISQRLVNESKLA